MPAMLPEPCRGGKAVGEVKPDASKVMEAADALALQTGNDMLDLMQSLRANSTMAPPTNVKHDALRASLEAAVIAACNDARRPLVEALRAIKAHDRADAPEAYSECFDAIMVIADAALAVIDEGKK